MALTEDLSLFFTDFGVTATPGGGGSAITVIFDRAHIAAMGGDISGTSPAALAVSADVASFLSNTTTLQIAGATYRVRDIQPDGTGLSLLILEKV